eukprot:GHVR01093179.1.p1 GENE.GHVR01093179.1~~GHVR01093179.1.p1  ORF type:complete len:135 (-),score=3.12 GHVR01093179.1:542-946(-)
MNDEFTLKIKIHHNISNQEFKSFISWFDIKFLDARVKINVLNDSYSSLEDYKQSNAKERVGLVRKLNGEGFHQTILYTLIVPERIDIQINPDQCYFQVNDILPSSTYIDFDQLKSNHRLFFSDPFLVTYETINV